MPGKHKRYSSWGSIWEWSMNLLEKTFSYDKTFDDVSWIEKFNPIKTTLGYDYKTEYNDEYNDVKRHYADERNDGYSHENDYNAEAEHQQDEYENEDTKISTEIRHDSHRPRSWNISQDGHQAGSWRISQDSHQTGSWRISQDSHQTLPWRFSQFSATFIHHDGQLPEIRIHPPSDDSDDEPRRYNYESDEAREEYLSTYDDDGHLNTDDNDDDDVGRNSPTQTGRSDSPTLGRFSRVGRFLIRQTRVSMSPPIRSTRASLVIEESQHQWWQRSQQQPQSQQQQQQQQQRRRRVEEANRPQPPAVIEENLGSKVTSVYSFPDRDKITCRKCNLRRRNRRY